MNMKCKLLAAVAVSAVVVGSTSFADGMSDVRPYVGAELSFNMPKHVKSKIGLGANVGVRICDYFGLEAGYNHVLKSKSKSKVVSDISVKVNNMYVDGMGYFAVSPEVDLIGAVGVGRLKVKIYNAAGSLTGHKTGYRLGAGVQYKFDENLAARFMARHQKAWKIGLKNMNSVALGVAYTF